MKFHYACVIAAILLFFVVAGALFSAQYLDHTVSYIIDNLDKLPQEQLIAAKEITIIQSFWEDRRKILSFSLPETSLDAISLLFEEALIAVNNSNNEDYQKATARLRRAVVSINQLEKISLSNIF